MSRSSVSSSSSKVAPSGGGANQNNASVLGDHGQPSKPSSVVQVTDDIESADIEQGTITRVVVKLRRVGRAKTFVTENKIYEKFEGYGLAVLSIIDMITDIVMITKFHAEGRHSFARASTICVSLCLGVQTFIVYGQNAKKSRARQVKEQLILFSLLKPGVDAWRNATATASNREEGIAIDPKTELTFSRGVELCFESIPGTVLQLAALVHAKENESMAYFALASSVITAATMSAYISWDWDMNEIMRKEASSFFGYIPKKSLARKVIVAISLFVSSFCCLLVRSLLCVCLAQKGLGVVAAVLVSESVVYFVAKAFVRDLTYWTPHHGVLGYLFALGGRFISKVLVDWTFLVQARSPIEVGGVGFCPRWS